MYKGIAASSGVVVSKVYKLEHPVLNIERKDADAETEIKKLSEALVKTQKDIETIQKKAVGKLTDEDLAIFDAHLMVTQDPEFIGQIEELIKSENINAEFAVNEVGGMFISMFEAMEDAYFKERP